MKKIISAIVLLWFFIFSSCKNENYEKTVSIEFINNSILYSSNEVASSNLADLFVNDHKPNSTNIILTTKFSEEQILHIKKEFIKLGVSTLRFSEQASGLRSDMRGGDSVSRSELEDALRIRKSSHDMETD